MAKRKLTAIMLSLMLVLTMAIGAGTFALFTDTAVNADNFFRAGTIDLGTEPEPMYYTGESHPRNNWMQQYDLPQAVAPYGGEALGGWAPGDSIDREMVIKNSGTLDAIVKGVHARINLDATPGGVTGLDQDDSRYQQFIDKMWVNISDRTGGGTNLYNGSLRDLLNTDSGGNGGATFTTAQQFTVGADRTIDFNVTMALDADNELQGLTWVFDFVFYAEQARNNGGNETQNGVVEGYVVDRKDNAAIVGAVVDFGNGYTAATNNEGMYHIELPAGTYSATAGKDGYESKTETGIPVTANTLTVLNFWLDPLVTPPADGIASGFITNAVNAQGVPGLTITFRSGHGVQSGTVAGTTTTGANGAYSIVLPAGNYTGEIVDPNGQFITTYFNIISVENVETPNQNAAVSPVMPDGDWRIVLTWGKTPADLDAHLTGPRTDNSNNRFHVYYNSKTYSNPGNTLRAKLDVDDTTSYGPETITISNQYQGVYRYSIHNYTNRNSNNNDALAKSGATVNVYKGNQLMETFTVPNQKGTLWTVFEINGNTITPRNTMSYVSNPTNVNSLPGVISLTDNLSETDAEIIGEDVFNNLKSE